MTVGGGVGTLVEGVGTEDLKEKLHATSANTITANAKSGMLVRLILEFEVLGEHFKAKYHLYERLCFRLWCQHSVTKATRL